MTSNGAGGSIAMRAACALLGRGPTKRRYLSPERMRGEYFARSYPSPVEPRHGIRKLGSVKESRIAGTRVLTVTPRKPSGRHIIYTHGGTYINELVRPHWWIIAELVRRTGAAVTVPLYRLAPEHSYREGYALLTEVYRRVLDGTEAADVVLSGDSAGGGLAVGQALHFAAEGLPAPGQLLLFSPWLDITGTNPETKRYQRVDPMLAVPGAVEAGSWWADGENPRHPLLSPVFAQPDALAALPPVEIHQGDRDICMADTRLFESRMHDAGGRLTVHTYLGAFHVFVALPFLPESRVAYGRMATLLR
ncbi:acetyl esterase/lipase [Arthrobacter pigmenti]|uniref:Acetyl esterase/lipase n=1 Tax=Arthrobacter pigmenti TaxID=271432 RepID=A0A846RNY9_9MICC|nr:alpha/beta hydrolase fold domain-containing protein [Arthrobacter pigmenti]NJC23300.1 acetyl esterase/lipase [Arthrobacter pigmenti]